MTVAEYKSKFECTKIHRISHPSGQAMRCNDIGEDVSWYTIQWITGLGDFAKQFSFKRILSYNTEYRWRIYAPVNYGTWIQMITCWWWRWGMGVAISQIDPSKNPTMHMTNSPRCTILVHWCIVGFARLVYSYTTGHEHHHEENRNLNKYNFSWALCDNKIWWLYLVPFPATRFASNLGYRMAKDLIGLCKRNTFYEKWHHIP